MTRERRSNRPRRRALIAGILLATLLICAEIGLRLSGPSLPPGCAPRPVIGYGLQPGLNLSLAGVNGPVTLATNRLGLRSPEPVEPKPDDTFRILAVGDEMWLGSDHAYHETAAGMLGGLLAESVKPVKIDLQSASAPGWGWPNYLSAVKALSPELKPDLLLVVTSLATDLDPGGDAGSIGARPRQGLDAKLAKLSALWTALSPAPGLPDGGPATVHLQTSDSGDGLTDLPEWITQLDRACRVARLPWVLAVIPAQIQTDPDRLKRRALAEGLSPDRLDGALPNRTLHMLVRRHRLMAVDLLPSFRRLADRFELYTPGGWTLSEIGHLTLAKEIAAVFERDGIIEQALLFADQAPEIPPIP